MKLTIGCTTRPYAKLPYGEAFAHIASAGYTDVAVFFDAGIGPDSGPDHTQAVRRAAAGVGLKPSMLIVHAELDKGLAEASARYKRMIDHAAALGTTWLLDTGTGKEEYYDLFFSVMDHVVPYAAANGVNITLKPHGGVTLTADALVAAYDRLRHPAFGISFDPGNIIYYTEGAARPETDVARVAPLVTTGIIKDCVLRDGKPDVLITPGEGLVDFDAVLSGLVSGGFRGPLYVECVGGQTLEEIDRNVLATREFVEEIIGRLPDA